MRIHLAIAALVALAAAAAAQEIRPAAAQAPIYQWCMQPSAQRGPECYFSTLEQCRATASAVGFCHENPFYTVARQGKAERRR